MASLVCETEVILLPSKPQNTPEKPRSSKRKQHSLGSVELRKESKEKEEEDVDNKNYETIEMNDSHKKKGLKEMKSKKGKGKGKEEENVNVRAAAIHIIGDLLQSIGVVIAGAIIFFYPTYTIVDPICTFVFSILVVFTTIPVSKDCIRVLMEGTPQNIDVMNLSKDLKEVSI